MPNENYSMKIDRYTYFLLFLLLLSSCSLQRALTVDQTVMDAVQITERYKPSGRIDEVYYSCSSDGPSQRKMLVYLPQGYEKGENRYPVIYLFHGARGNETSWFKDGDFVNTQETLVREGKAVPAIVVLTNMNQYDDDKDYGNSRFKNPFESYFNTDGSVESVFVHDVVRVIDEKYRTIRDKSGRAIAGLSVGAMQSIYISAAYPDMFDYVGLFSPTWHTPHIGGKYMYFYSEIDHKLVHQFENPPQLYQIQIGRADIFRSHVKRFRGVLRSAGANYEYISTSGGHNWKNWKDYYKTFAQRAFKPK